jgi:hypothetical protein
VREGAVQREADQVAVVVDGDGAVEVVVLVDDPAPQPERLLVGQVALVELAIPFEEAEPREEVLITQRADLYRHAVLLKFPTPWRARCP